MGSARSNPAQTSKGKPTIWRWQARALWPEGVDGLLHDVTRPSGKKPLAASTIERVVDMTSTVPSGAATHWVGRVMGKAAEISDRSVQRVWSAH